MKTVIATALEDLASIKHWLRLRPEDAGPVDFVHIVRRSVYATDFMQVTESPTPEQFGLWRETFAEHLRTQLFSCLPATARGSSTVHILLANDEAEEMVNYLVENKAKLLVVGTRGLKGLSHLFTSSFAQKMLREAPCDLLVLRPRS
jgi:nucleotide-binding universal stress UspA family protein